MGFFIVRYSAFLPPFPGFLAPLQIAGHNHVRDSSFKAQVCTVSNPGRKTLAHSEVLDRALETRNQVHPGS
jgi:hypothetical protein